MAGTKPGHDEKSDASTWAHVSQDGREGLQLLLLTRKITGSVKFNPSSATSGGGCGTGSDLRTIASAAWSNAASPDPLTILVESTWPFRSSSKLTTISALFCERSAG